MPTVYVRGWTQAEVKALVHDIGAGLAGRSVFAGASLEPVRRAVGQEAIRLIDASFWDKSVGGSGADGRAWAALAPATVRGRRRGASGSAGALLVRPTTPILRSGPDSPLYASLKAVGASQEQVLRTEYNGVTVGSDNPVAAFHHRGTKTIPPRPLWPDPHQWPPVWRTRLAGSLGLAILGVVVDQLQRMPP